MNGARVYRKGEIRQFPVRQHTIQVPSEDRIINAVKNKTEQFPFWDDGTPKSLNNVFNWRFIK